MYCRNCGNELLKTDKFCEKCGKAIINSQNTNINNIEQENNEIIKNNDLPLNWLNFWKYIRFPVGIFLSVFNIGNYLVNEQLELNIIIILAFLIDVSSIIFMCVTFYHFAYPTKKGYALLNIWLLVELLLNSFNTTLNSSTIECSTLLDFVTYFVITFTVLGLIWTLPNYIYFKKRKYYFSDVDNAKYNKTEDKDVEELIKRL